MSNNQRANYRKYNLAQTKNDNNAGREQLMTLRSFFKIHTHWDVDTASFQLFTVTTETLLLDLVIIKRVSRFFTLQIVKSLLIVGYLMTIW